MLHPFAMKIVNKQCSYRRLFHNTKHLQKILKNGASLLNRPSDIRSHYTKDTATVKQHLSTTHVRSQSQAPSYINGCSSEPLIGATIGQLLEGKAEKLPDKEAFVFRHQNIRVSFEQLLLQSDKFAAGLRALGVCKGDRVGICAPNCIEWIIVQYSTARAGIIMVNINPAYQVPELEFALKKRAALVYGKVNVPDESYYGNDEVIISCVKVGVKLLVIAERFKTQAYYEMMLKICPELEHNTTPRINSKSLPALETLVVIGNQRYRNALSFTDVMESSTNQLISTIRDEQKFLQFDDPINIQFTSGTTGQPKGALLTHHGIVNNAKFTGMRLDYHRRETRICVPVPLYHCFGMVMASLQAPVWGATCIFPSAGFDPDAALAAVQQERCTSLYGTPTMFIDMLHLPNFNEFDLSTLYTGIMAGSPCPIEVMKKVIDRMHMKHVTICYGTTENSPVTFQSMMDDDLEKRVTTVGTPHPHVEAKIVDEEGRIVPLGQKGELCIRGYGVMRGYWNDAEQTARVIGPDRWYKTGDVAVLSDDGFLKIVGRIKDMIIRGGENIYPVEIEQFLYKHPKIADVQVIGVPDERLGEQVAALIRLKQGQIASRQEILDFCKGQISHFKIPYYVHFVNEFPLTATGKVQKYKLREAAVKQYFGDKNTD